MNTVNLAKPYVVDVFRVTGGTTHDYTFSWRDALEPNRANHLPPGHEQQSVPDAGGERDVGFGQRCSILRLLAQREQQCCPGNFQITYSDTGTQPSRHASVDDGRPECRHRLSRHDTRAGAGRQHADQFFNSQGLVRPSAIIRHRIPSGTLQDLFVSVIEPFNTGVSNIVSVTRLPMGGTDERIRRPAHHLQGRTYGHVHSQHAESRRWLAQTLVRRPYRRRTGNTR